MQSRWVCLKHSCALRSNQIGLLGLLLGLWLSGCTQTTPLPKQSQSNPTVEATQPDSAKTVVEKTVAEKTVVLTTFTVLADMARNVAGDRAVVESITKPGAEVHGYEPTPSDLKRGQGAGLILDNGLNLERWAERFYNSFPQVKRTTLSEGIQPISISADVDQGNPNPHAWMSPQNALIYVDNIRQALGTLDPDSAAIYNANAKAYSQQIRAIDQKLKQAMAAIPPEQRYLVSCEGAFSYLARDYGLQEVYIWPVNAEQQATPKQVERVINTVKASQVPAVFCESTVNNEAQLQVAKETGAKFAGVLYVDSLSPEDGPAPTYLKLLEYNVNTLIQGLQGH